METVMPIKINPCKSCGSHDLKSKWDSDAKMGWVRCEGCGNVSSPVDLTMTDEIVKQWNAENHPKN